MAEFHHLPVLLNEVLENLAIDPAGVYLDGTLGGAGHACRILERLTTGTLIGIDRDADAIAAATARLTACQTDGRPHFQVIPGNFHDARALLGAAGIFSLNGALLDLGVSSHQLDERSRGFSYHEDAPLDMRMDQHQPLTAAAIVNTWAASDIARILRDYGEENWSAQIARVIVDRRKDAPITTTARLVDIIDAAIPAKFRQRDAGHPARRTFQALRIAVNDELNPLENALRDLVDMLLPGGRLCVIAFHSLEDRIVKNTFRSLQNPCTCPKNMPICVCGKKPVVDLVTRKPIIAGAAELADNPRARSATLRVVQKRTTEDA